MSSKAVVVILCSDWARSQALAHELASDTFETLPFEWTDALYRAVNFQRVDYLVIEHKLEAFVTGLEVLERIFRELVRPKSILLIEPTEQESSKAQHLGIDLLLPKDSDANMIRSSIESLRNQGAKEGVFIHPLAREIVKNAKEITPMPQLVVKMARYISERENVDLRALANDISVDPKIMASLLRLVNSAAFGFQAKFTKVVDAVSMLGVRRTISLVLTMTAFREQNALANLMHPDDRLWYNKRTVLMASTAFCFAKHVGKVSPDTAFVLSLFQEVGILIMANYFGERYHQALQRVRQLGQLQLEAVEQASFGITHADVGGAILQKWELPASIISPVLMHHRPTPDNISEIEQRFLHVMRVAEASANLTDGHIPQRYPALRRLIEAYGKENADRCRTALQESMAKTAESSQLFQISIPDPAELNTMVEKLLAQASTI